MSTVSLQMITSAPPPTTASSGVGGSPTTTANVPAAGDKPRRRKALFIALCSCVFLCDRACVRVCAWSAAGAAFFCMFLCESALSALPVLVVHCCCQPSLSIHLSVCLSAHVYLLGDVLLL